MRPSDLDDIKPVPNFRGVTPPDSPGRSWDYGYNVYPPIDEGEGGGGEGKSFCYPAKVIETNITYTDFRCEVYENGILNAPVIVEVTQLQLSEGPIPVGTWCLVAKNEVMVEHELGQPVPEWEYTMQVPVWL